MSNNTSNKSKSNFVVQGSILAIAGLLVRVIGMVYRIPLQNHIGDGFMGIYSSAFQVYNILLLLSSYSLPLAVSKMISARLAVKKYNNAYRVFKITLVFAFIVGTIASLVTYFGAHFFADNILKMPNAYFAIIALSPAVFIMAILGVLRGFFQGHGTMVPTAISQILEQIANAVLSIICGFIFFDIGRNLDLIKGTSTYADAYAAAGVTIGTVAGALVALLFFVFVFFMYNGQLKSKIHKEKISNPESYRYLFTILLMTIGPVILSSVVYNVSSIVDNSIFGHYMMEFKSFTESQYEDVWGVYTGKYTLFTNIPIAIASSLASSIIPSISATIASGNKKQLFKKIELGIRVAMIVAIPASIGLAVLGDPIMKLIYPSDNGLAGILLLMGSSAVVFYSLSTITNAVLQGIGKMAETVKNAALSLVIHIIILAILLYGFNLGIYGVVIANIAFALIMCILNAMTLKKFLNYYNEIWYTFVIPLFAGGIMGGAAYGAYKLVYMLCSRNSVATLIAIAIAVIVYIIALLLFKCFTENEIKSFPMGKKIAKVLKKLHLI